MGIYLNSPFAYTLYKSETMRPYFVDKSELLKELFPLVEEGNNHICITRPRRFGKTVMANMIAAFFNKDVQSGDIFNSLQIAKANGYKEHLNKHNVIHINFSNIPDTCVDYKQYIETIKKYLIYDLQQVYPECFLSLDCSLAFVLSNIYAITQEKFIFVLDEWDYVFHQNFVNAQDKQEYLRFLSNLLKDKPYVSFVYMTGILPISKYSSGSELNMFLEFTMAKSKRFSSYLGFTEKEVDELYEKYLHECDLPEITREGLRLWYDGYSTAAGERIYNPRSVVSALRYNHLESYWTSSGPYDEIFYYIEKNVDDVRNDIALMVSGIPVKAKIQEYAAASMNLNTKDEIFSAMVVYGFLRYEDGYVSIPNKELMNKFEEMIRKEQSLGYIYQLTEVSEKMLKATLDCDTNTMTEILEFAHNTESPLLSYNNEAELTALINLVYLSARDSYRIEREDKAGIGYVDFIFYPERNYSDDAIILELKVDHSAEEAIQQIKEKQYALRFEPKMGETRKYTGRVLAVGLAYDKQTKEHSCRIEVL